jgi:hypothetical protein
VDPEVAGELHEIIAKYYESKIAASLKEGNVEGAEKIVSAAQTIGGHAADQIVRSVEQNKAQAEKIQTYKTRAQAASEKEREGFESLLAGDYDNAIKAFQSAEAAYPSYHQVYELARLIRQKKPDLADPERRKELFRLVVSQYAYGAPSDLLERLREMSK